MYDKAYIFICNKKQNYYYAINITNMIVLFFRRLTKIQKNIRLKNLLN